MQRSSLPLSLYIHIPWCIRKCPYCDFNSHESKEGLPESDYVSALLLDLKDQMASVQNRDIETIFIGGGTPSLFSPGSLESLFQGIRELVHIRPDAEITLEANPGTAEAERFRRYREIGVTRLSIGIQSFEASLLQAIGRIHDGQEAIAAAQMAKAAGFQEFNLDLMFGLPGQTETMALKDIETAIALEPTHLSFYQLTLEPNTVFYKYPPRLPDEDATWSIQQAAQSQLNAAGYLQYEVSAYARVGSRCRHNLNYWKFGDYLGIGAGSHGKITDPQTGVVTRRQQLKLPTGYMNAIRKGEQPGSEIQISPEELPFEFLMNGLRLREGFEIQHLEERAGISPERLEPWLSRLIQDDLLERTPTHIRCSVKGFNYLDTVLEHFLPASSC